MKRKAFSCPFCDRCAHRRNAVIAADAINAPFSNSSTSVRGVDGCRFEHARRLISLCRGARAPRQARTLHRSTLILHVCSARTETRYTTGHDPPVVTHCWSPQREVCKAQHTAINSPTPRRARASLSQALLRPCPCTAGGPLPCFSSVFLCPRQLRSGSPQRPLLVAVSVSSNDGQQEQQRGNGCHNQQHGEIALQAGEAEALRTRTRAAGQDRRCQHPRAHHAREQREAPWLRRKARRMAQRKDVPHSAFAATSLPPALVVQPPRRASSAFPCAVGGSGGDGPIFGAVEQFFIFFLVLRKRARPSSCRGWRSTTRSPSTASFSM